MPTLLHSPICMGDSSFILNLKKRGDRRTRGYCSAVATSREGTPTTASRPAGTVIKVCGIVCPEDAELSAAAGADFIGMIMWTKAKRAVSVSVARSIANAARRHNAEAVGVFVDETADVIARTCEEAELDLAQLHGPGAREALLALPNSLGVIYVMHADSSGQLHTAAPASPAGAALPYLDHYQGRAVDWVLVDGMVGGSGETYDWAQLTPPRDVGQQGWFLAGGLSPQNVAQAVDLLRPTGVDVSSGVTCPDKLRKDASKVHAFVSAVRRQCC